ncbi:Hypothetical protein CINCED_3A010368 [Cinara cedri]|nr:Hypothetical protein CINCED_3A010368 [Cinara cedri]
MNVALVSRNANKLRDVAREIHDRHGRKVRTRVVVADFTSAGRGPVTLTETFESVSRGLAGLDVAVLVNNAGMANAKPDRFTDMTAADGHGIVECNALAAVAMCRVVIPLMSEGGRRCRMLFGDDGDGDDEHLTLLLSTTPEPPPPTPDTRGGVVVNVGSASFQLPFPTYAVYAATKSFLEKFSVELAAEYDALNGQPTYCSPVAVRCLTPGVVATKMTRMRPSGDEGPLTFLPGPRAYARHSLRSLGCHCACRLIRRDERTRDDRETGTAGARGSPRDCDREGVLAGVLSAVFDSPSSPFSVGCAGVTTTGYLPHTLMMMMGHAVVWTMGRSFLSNFVYEYLSRTRDRIVRRNAKKAEEKAAKI